MSKLLGNEAGLLQQQILSEASVGPLIDSYNNFVAKSIEDIISNGYHQLNEISYYSGQVSRRRIYYIHFSEVKFSKPTLRYQDQIIPKVPAYDRLYKGNYVADMYATAKIYYREGNSGEALGDFVYDSTPGNTIRVPLGQMPILLGSFLDNLYGMSEEERYQRGEPEKDPRCYFIINGKEISLVNVEKLRLEEPIIYIGKTKQPILRYNIATETGNDTIQISANKQAIVILNLSLYGDVNNEDVGLNVFMILYFFIRNVMGLQLQDIIYDPTVESDPLKVVMDYLMPFITLAPSASQKLSGRGGRGRIGGPLEFQKRKFRTYMASTANEFLDIISRTDETQTASKYDAAVNYIYKIYANNTSHTREFVSSDKESIIAKFQRAVFPNVDKNVGNGNEIDRLAKMDGKLRTLAYMVVRFAQYQITDDAVNEENKIKIDDRDSWYYKRVVDVGEHLRLQFVQAWNKDYIGELTKKEIIQLDANPDPGRRKTLQRYETHLIKMAGIDSLTNDGILAKNIIEALNNGRMGNKDYNTKDSTIARPLNRDSIFHSYNQIKMITVPSSGKGNNSKSREIKTSQYFGVCPFRTPEGGNCGMVNDFALNAIVSLPQDPGLIIRFLQSSDLSLIHQTRKDANHRSVLLNGIHLGFGDTALLRQKLRSARFVGAIPIDTGIVYSEELDLRIVTSSGRLCRPILVVENNKLLLDERNLRGQPISQLIRHGVLEYIDIAEQEYKDIRIAVSKEDLITLQERIEAAAQDNRRLDYTPYSHMEIDSSAMAGVSANILPYIGYEPTIRASYATSMVMQGMGPNIRRNELYFSTTSKEILYPGLQGVTTEFHEALTGDAPSGYPVVMFVMTQTGNEQEDAILLNSSSVARGMFASMVYRSETITNTENQKLGVIDKYMRREGDKVIYDKRFSKIDPETFIVRKGAYVEENDILVARYKDDKVEGKVDISKILGPKKSGIVDEVLVKNIAGGQLIQIRIRSLRKVMVGDKFASRHGQKGTAGELIEQEDLPYILIEGNPNDISDPVERAKFTKVQNMLNGLRPDVVFNPHSVPSRMTVSQLIEMLAGTLQTATGMRENASMAKNRSADEIKEALGNIGLRASGTYTVVSGITGKPLKAEIYMGTIYYQALKHQVLDKHQAAGLVKKSIFNRQPIKGQKSDGALRFGEMERDAFVSKGASKALRDALRTRSDAHTVKYCAQCKKMVQYPRPAGIGKFQCNFCLSLEVGDFDTIYARNLIDGLLAGKGIHTEYGGHLVA